MIAPEKPACSKATSSRYVRSIAYLEEEEARLRDAVSALDEGVRKPGAVGVGFQEAQRAPEWR